ncbi:LCP family protein [Patulibacter sp. SYSU D01012]|uniref:LCP family protein n=1 Tax=Patulibacter sp. SYSU D01012 TaxID=2817381 RepID=UPI001B304122|nr:LCP family protein [Patulibacter sp. SYSU D01012]
MSTPPRTPRPGLGFALRFLLAGVLVLGATGATVATAIQGEAQDVTDKIVRKGGGVDEKTAEALSDVTPGKPQTLLLVGDDRRKGEAGGSRSDTMILVRLDPDAKATTMLSLPRDLIITGKDGQPVRLNSAFGNGTDGLIDTLKRILSTPGEPFDIHHVVSIRFTAFSQAVNDFGCFYADVDRKYFNDNNPPAGGGSEPYAAIDVPAGYQRLCGEDSLAYVRFRHLDNDIVREARQQHYLTEARAQMATSSLIQNQDELVDTITDHVKTDIRSSRGLLGVAKLALGVVGHPTQRVSLDVTDTSEGALQATPQALAAAAKQFLHPDAPPSAKKREAARTKPSPSSASKKKTKRKRRATAKTPATLTDGAAAAKQVVRDRIARGFTKAPVYLPKLMEHEARYEDDDSRAYDIQSRNGETYPWQAYRLVVYLAGGQDGAGQYYGVQGTTWKNPPVLALAKDETRLAGRTYRIEYDGRRIRRLIWQTPSGTYWINNTLKNSLTNDEMRAIARSLVRYEG